MSISQDDQRRISNAIQSAEAKSAGQIVCVLAQTSSRSTALPVFLASVAALALPWLLVALTSMTVYRILSLQALLFIAVLLVLCLPRVRVALLPRRARRAVAHRVAMEQFTRRGLGRAKAPPGILIFVSLAERYARIIADDAVASRVRPSEWQTAIDALIAHIRDGRIAEGFIAAIDICGNELTTHFPRGEAHQEPLPDRIYLI